MAKTVLAKPAASVAFTATVKIPADAYACVCGLAPQELKPSPKLTHLVVTASSSVAVKLTETVVPTLAEFGETLTIVTVGARSLTVTIAVFEPVPALFVALTVTVKTLLSRPPAL